MNPPGIQPASLGFPPDLTELRRRPLDPVEVAVVDSGVDATHPWIEGKIAAVYTVESGGDAVEILEAEMGTNHDVFGHGTAVASLVLGIAPNARLVDMRVLLPGNLGTGAALVAGLGSVLERRCPVVNMSLAATAKFARPLRRLCTKAYRQGQVVVASRRNMPLGDNGYPAEFPGSIAVESADTSTLFQVLYRTGADIEFAAQGEEVRVAAAGGGYRIMTGTSFATPVVSGICALLLGWDPTLRPFEIKTLLKAYAAAAA